MLKDYRQEKDNHQEDCSIDMVKAGGFAKDYRLIDEAWDLFADYIGEKRMQTPLSLLQFEIIFDKVAQGEKFKVVKADVLKSFRYDSYSWPLVERESKPESE